MGGCGAKAFLLFDEFDHGLCQDVLVSFDEAHVLIEASEELHHFCLFFNGEGLALLNKLFGVAALVTVFADEGCPINLQQLHGRDRYRCRLQVLIFYQSKHPTCFPDP